MSLHLRHKMADHLGENTELTRAVDDLRDQLARLNDQRLIKRQNSWPRIIFYQMVRGLVFGLGSTLGATVLLTFLIRFLGDINFIPIIGEWASEIVKIVQKDDF